MSYEKRYKNLIASVTKPDDEVIAKMTEFLGNNRGFAEQVCAYLADYYIDWAMEFIDDEDDNPKIILDRQKIADIFNRNTSDWSFMLQQDICDDRSYEIYYKMHDFCCASVRDYCTTIIEKYIRYKLNL